MGVATYVEEDYWPLNTALYVKDFRGNDPRFIYYLLRSMDFRAYNSGSAQPSLNRNYVAQVRVLLPPIDEQRSIAEILGALDDKIASNVRLGELAESLAITYVQSASSTAPLKDFVVIGREQMRPADFAGSAVAMFSLPAFDAGRLPEQTAGARIKSNKFVVGSPAVLVARLNPHIPRVWCVVPQPGLLALASTEFVVLHPRPGYPADLVWAACADPSFIAAVAEGVTGTTGSHQRVRAEDVVAAQVANLAQLSDETRTVVRSLVSRTASAREESAVLAALRDALLPALISGDLGVHEADELVVEAV